MANPNLHVCEHCRSTYDWRKSASSSLKMTYCSAICERNSLGFTIEYLLKEWGPPLKPRELVAA